MHPDLPWPGPDEHSLVLNFPWILIVVSSPQEAGPSVSEGLSEPLRPFSLSLLWFSHFSHLPLCLLLNLLSCLSASAFLPLPSISLHPPPSVLSLGRLQMENICSLELCNSPFYYFF